MIRDKCPLAVMYGYRNKKNELSFVGRKGIISLFGRSRDIEKILRLCNGMNNVQSIIDQLSSVNPDKVSELLSLCEEQGIVRDSRNLFASFHSDSSNPPLFSYDHGIEEINRIMNTERLRERGGEFVQLLAPPRSNLLKTIEKRLSVRQFRKAQIPLAQLSGLLAAAYGVGENGHWSVPSGGALYPLDLYLIIPHEGQFLHPGIYRWEPEKRGLSVISGKDPLVWLTKVFNTEDLLKNVSCILCIAANLNRTIAKYANRGYLLTLLEAGHAAQNASLYCTEQDIGSVEYCGFCDEMLAREIGLHFPQESVITTLIIGIPECAEKVCSRTDHEMADNAHRLKHELVGNDKPIIDASFWEPKIKNLSLSQWGAVATYRPSNGRLTASALKYNRGFATGSTTNEAVIKAIAEGFERYALQQYRFDLTESAKDIHEPFLDPRLVVPYVKNQYKMLGITEQFDPKKKTNWIFGSRKANGERIYVPTDLVFFAPHQSSGRRFFYRANSSGVAAHFDKQMAIQAGLFELIERDAFCTTWYSKRSVEKISDEYLPTQLRNRMSCWKDIGYNISLLNITLDGPPVVLAMIWSKNKMPALFSGAACRLSFIEAAEKALSEAELMGITWHFRRPKYDMCMNDIKNIEDHGLFYLNPKNLTFLDWLLQSRISKTVPKDFKGNMNIFDPVVVDITPKENGSKLTVVRVLSEKLMPINFGYGTEHRRHDRMSMLGFKWNMGNPSIPHFFA